ncbi:MAG: hypothetical protein FWF59_08730 [Turicibacter sp.]|nr:hypothetical protein [Turicibacter sp.]
MKGQLTQRDINLLEFCEKQLPISTDMAAILFYPNRYIAQRRLSVIHQLKQLKRSERLFVNQPYIYYHSKKNLKNLPFTKLLCDITDAGYEIESYRFDDNLFKVVVNKEENTYQVNSTLQNMKQVYRRLELAS